MLTHILTMTRNGLLASLSVMWLAACDGATTSSSESSQESSVNTSSSAPTNTTPDVALGEELYNTHCLKCHGVDGQSPFDIDKSNLSLAEMIEEVDLNMPPDTEGDCDNECAIHVSEYVQSVLLAAGPDISNERRPIAARIIKPHYINSVKDLLGVTLTQEQQDLIPVEFINEKGFITAFDSQQLITPHIEAFTILSRQVSDTVDIVDLSLQLANCNILTAGNFCVSEFVKNAGLKFFRQPIDSIDQARLETLFNTVASFEDSDREDAAKAVLRALMQSPQFLYRLERETEGGQSVRLLNGYELASRLAFFLWQSSPDDQLLDFAASVEQNGFNEAALRTQVERMLADEKVSRTRTAFWLDYTLSSTSALLGASPQVAEELRRSVVETALRVSGNNGVESPLQDLFTTTDWILTPQLAQNLGLAPLGEGYRVYDTANLPQRAGLLTHPGFIANIGSTSFVGRGVILTERVLCREIQPPPPGIQNEIDQTAEETLDYTPKQASDYRFGLGGVCKACHSTFEPIAFAFEQFDVLGNHSTQDDKGRDLFASGYLQTKSGGVGPSYQNAPELMQILANSEETSECFSRNMMKFAIGRSYASHADEQITIAHRNHMDDGGTFTALMRAIAMNPLFRTLYVIESH